LLHSAEKPNQTRKEVQRAKRDDEFARELSSMQPDAHSPVARLKLYGFSVWRGSEQHRKLAKRWTKLSLSSSFNKHKWERMRNNFYQHTTDQPLLASKKAEAERQQLLQDTEAFGLEALGALEIDHARLKLACSAIKVLRTEQDEGRQDIHFDIPGKAKAERCYTILLHCGTTISTCVPRNKPLAELREHFTTDEETIPADKLTPGMFDSIRVDAGDHTVFNCTLPHFGPANPNYESRIVVFLMFSPTDEPTPDTDDQRYPHGPGSNTK